MEPIHNSTSIYIQHFNNLSNLQHIYNYTYILISTTIIDTYSYVYILPPSLLSSYHNIHPRNVNVTTPSLALARQCEDLSDMGRMEHMKRPLETWNNSEVFPGTTPWKINGWNPKLWRMKDDFHFRLGDF